MARYASKRRVAVETQSAWSSKINLTQAVAFAAMGLTLFTGNKYNLPAEQQAMIVSVIVGIQSIATWVLHTWFQPKVNAASVPEHPPIIPTVQPVPPAGPVRPPLS